MTPAAFSGREVTQALGPGPLRDSRLGISTRDPAPSRERAYESRVSTPLRSRPKRQDTVKTRMNPKTAKTDPGEKSAYFRGRNSTPHALGREDEGWDPLGHVPSANTKVWSRPRAHRRGAAATGPGPREPQGPRRSPAGLTQGHQGVPRAGVPGSRREGFCPRGEEFCPGCPLCPQPLSPRLLRPGLTCQPAAPAAPEPGPHGSCDRDGSRPGGQPAGTQCWFLRPKG